MPPRHALFEIDADVLVPGARVGVIDEHRAARLGARASCPQPRAVDRRRPRGPRRRRRRRTRRLRVQRGAVVGYTSPASASRAQVLERVEQTVIDLVAASSNDARGVRERVRLAEEFLRSWRPPDEPRRTPAGVAGMGSGEDWGRETRF